MTTAMRWRIFVLQAGLIGVLAFTAGFGYWANSFIQGQIRDQLTAQQIFFPPAGSRALDPAEFPDLQQYAGKQVVDGETARAYANGFIGRHLKKIAGGLTYSQVSAQAQQNPQDTKLASQVQLLFRGETLRGLLLNAYGWWTIGTYTLYAAIGLTLAAGAILAAFLFEVFGALRERRTVMRRHVTGQANRVPA